MVGGTEGEEEGGCLAKLAPQLGKLAGWIRHDLLGRTVWPLNFASNLEG